jgi:hypothetical protein
MSKYRTPILMAFLVILLAACQGTDNGSDELTVIVDADGTSQGYTYDKQISVGQFLEEIGITLGELDQVNPPLYTQLTNGIRITVSRIVERNECNDEPLPYETEIQPWQGLPPGDSQIVQTGENGVVQVCYLITEKDGVEISRNANPPIVVKEPRTEIVYVGSEPLDTLISIEGKLAYIAGGQAWIVEGNTVRQRFLTTDGRLDGRVFDLSANGQYLLYTRSTEDETDPEFSNELWAILNTAATEPQPVQLVPTDVRYAQWVPGTPAPTVSYSTAIPTDDVPNWRAFNDLWVMELNPDSGDAISVDEVVATNQLGAYSYWGRGYQWSPDGSQVAWALADSVGVVDLETDEFVTLLSFPVYTTALENFWLWIPKLSWTDGGNLITTVHGKPYGAESPEESIIFDTAVVDTTSGLKVSPFFSESGIWATPTYSPRIDEGDGNYTYLVAYFQAREPLNSPGSQYDLWVADSDGSNPRLLFPGPNQQGLRPDPEDGVAWSPTGRYIAVIHQKNLWIIEVQTGTGYQITSGGQASRPRWSRTR